MGRMLFIVARDDTRLYESLRREFAGEPGVEVILDRRAGEPGTGPAGERRRPSDVDERLSSLGWAIVRI